MIKKKPKLNYLSGSIRVYTLFDDTPLLDDVFLFKEYYMSTLQLTMSTSL